MWGLILSHSFPLLLPPFFDLLRYVVLRACREKIRHAVTKLQKGTDVDTWETEVPRVIT